MDKIISSMIGVLLISSLLSAQNSSDNKISTNETKKESQSISNTQPSSQAIGEISVGMAVIALDVEDRVPQDTGTIFPAEVKRLYCFSEILNGEGGEIQHRWYWNDELLNSVSLKIGSKRFRTYSAKTILPYMKGKWRVAIVNSANETTLKWLEFTIE